MKLILGKKSEQEMREFYKKLFLAEQSAELSKVPPVGAKVKSLRELCLIGFATEEIANAVSSADDDKKAKGLRQDKRFQINTFDTTDEINLLLFFNAGHEFVITRIVARNSNDAVDYFLLIKATEETVCGFLRTVPTIDIYIALANQNESTLRDKKVELMVSHKYLQLK